MAIEKRLQLDIVTPCFNEQECIELFYDEVRLALDALPLLDYTVYFIDDGSSDATLAKVLELEKLHGDKRIRYISFTRNFGKEAAIYAGLRASTGDYVVLMDTDLQDPPALLPRMLKAITDEGYDSVATYRVDRRGEPPVRSWFARLFYRLMAVSSDLKLQPGARDYRMMTAGMRDAIVSMGERERFYKGLSAWVGFNTLWLDYDNIPRAGGVTKWSFWKLFDYAIGGIAAFSTAPLRLASLLGSLMLAMASAYAVFVLSAALHNKTKPSITNLLLLFIGGKIILLLGIIGEYIARIYTEVLNRPLYLVHRTNVDAAADSTD